MRDREYSAFMLQSAPGFGAKSIFYIYESLKRLGLNINDLFEKKPAQLTEYFPEIGHGKFSRANLSTIQSLDNEILYTTYQKLKQEQIHIIGLDDDRYPKLVTERLGENAPPILFCKGSLPLLQTNSISIVGSRSISETAILLTKRIATRIAEMGYNVTSGFAKGVDTNAHIGALESNGTTTMVLSYGFDHLSVKKDIKAYNWERNSLFVSQFMPHERFSGQNAMTRNKLVCTLSNAVIVISSGPERDSNGKMSGTFDAALTALRYNIPLFVLNPSLLNPAPQGNIDLIKIGGIPLSNGDELVRHLDRLKFSNRSASTKEYNQETIAEVVQEPQSKYQTKAAVNDLKEKIFDLISRKKLSVNEIIEQIAPDWTPQELTNLIKEIDEIEIVKRGNTIQVKRKERPSQINLF